MHWLTAKKPLPLTILAVGVDIETIRPILPGVPARVCAQEELRVFEFFELWVLKESFIKVFGNTKIALKSIVFSLENGRILTPDSGITARLFHNIPGCKAAVCTTGDIIPEFIEIVDKP